MRVIEIENLGYAAAIVTIGTETLLLMDVALSEDERIGYMVDAMADLN